jgi:NAD+ kinase
MPIKFSKIGLMGKHTNPEVRSTLASLVAYLHAAGASVFMEQNCAQIMRDSHVNQIQAQDFGDHCDLMIIVGGDGSLLSAARVIVDKDVPVVGVNRGRRGFLTDISPQALTQSLEPILNGAYHEEHRFLLQMQLWREEEMIGQGIALNDVVLYSGDISRMIEFQVFIDHQFVQRQRSDGLITATPTGSTAHALAAGGPILYPSLEAIVLVPMHPTLLSSRPIVVDSRGQIELHLLTDSVLHPRISCDGQVHFDAKPDDRILIQRKAKTLRLLHPTDYDYYHTLRTKLGWSA